MEHRSNTDKREKENQKATCCGHRFKRWRFFGDEFRSNVLCFKCGSELNWVTSVKVVKVQKIKAAPTMAAEPKLSDQERRWRELRASMVLPQKISWDEQFGMR